MEDKREKVSCTGYALIFLCVSPAGYINNNYYNNDNNGVRPFWWRARQSKQELKSRRHIKRMHNLSVKDKQKGHAV